MFGIPKPTGWTHVVVNYIGQQDGQGMEIYHNGESAGSDHTKSLRTLSAGDGRVVLGRAYTDLDTWYAPVDIDEILFFNRKLSAEDIRDIQNMVEMN